MTATEADSIQALRPKYVPGDCGPFSTEHLATAESSTRATTRPRSPQAAHDDWRELLASAALNFSMFAERGDRNASSSSSRMKVRARMVPRENHHMK